jgi:cell division cycle 14
MVFNNSNVCQKVELLPEKLYLAFLQRPAAGIPTDIPVNSLCYWMDDDLIYEPFCADFGPCNMAHTYRFCMRMNNLMQQAEAQNRTAYLLVGPHPHKRANAAALVGIYSALYLDKDPQEAYAPLAALEPYAGFRDASCGMPLYELEIPNVIRGMAHARDVGFLRWADGEAFDVEEYEHYEQVENGDLNWIVPGKFMAFSGPSAQPKHYAGWRTFSE